MPSRTSKLWCLLSILLLAPVAHAAECTCAEPKAKPSAPEVVLKDVKGMKCPVNETVGCEGGYCSNKVKRDIFAEHGGRRVYFCCKGCVEAFTKDPKPFMKEVRAQWKVIDAKRG